MIPAFLGILALYIATNTYIAVRLWRWLGISSRPLACLFGGVFALLASAFVIAELWGSLPDWLARPLSLLGGWYLAAYIFLLILVPVCHLALRGKGGPMTAVVIIFAALCVTVFGALTASNVRVKEYTVRLEAPRDMRIALISDMHIGELIGRRHMEKMVEAINSIDADYVLIAGDIFDAGPGAVRDKETIGHLFGQIKSKYGIYACLGNHDGGFRGQEDDAIRLLESWGVNVLADEAASIEDVNIFGRKDRSGARLPAHELMAGTDDGFNIVIDHQPYEFDEEKAAGADLILCGHTHRGQIFPFSLVTKAMYRIDYGMLNEDNCTMIVSSGAGTWGPRVRLGSNCEVVRINIEAVKN